jgi:hypothetical protein
VKFSFAYVKKNPILFTMIFLVFGVLVLLVLNKGASSSGNAVASGPSDAQIQAQAALAAKQLDIAGQVQLGGLSISGLAQQGQNDLALANVASTVALAQVAADVHNNDVSTAASLAALTAQLAANVQMNNSNNQFQVDYAKIAADTSLHIVQANNALQTTLSHDQLVAYQTGSIVQSISSAKKGDRDQLTAALIGSITGQPISYGIPGAKGSIEVNNPNLPAPIPNSSGGGGLNVGSLAGGIFRWL